MRTKFFSLAIVATTLLISSCGNTEKKAENESSEPPKSMTADVPKDDGQGVGKFKDITLAQLDEKIAAQGKIVFDSKCSACHNPTGVKKVGPGLKGVTERRKPAWILNQITNPAEMTQKDPTSKALLAQYLTQMTFQDVTDDQAKSILEFLRQNDGVGSVQTKN
jgi:cytochrome c2